MYAVGLMSGTSLDGLDTVLVKIEGNYLDTQIEMLAFETFKFSKKLKEKIKQACDIQRSNTELICTLNFELGYFFAEGVKRICQKHDFPLTKLDFIASHGQTIFHIPEAANNLWRSTLQIGEPAVIAYETKTKVVSNFRPKDMVVNGQGAPLVPYSEFILYGNKGKNFLLQNIGGIGNVTFIPNNGTLTDIFAFDTGPGNMIIDEFMRYFYQKEYDEDGAVASTGNVDTNLLNYLKNNDYFSLKPPKSTGRELFGKQYVDKILQDFSAISAEDFITTATMFTAWSIINQYETFIFKKYKIDVIVLSGGGAYNKTLKKFIQGLIPQIEVLTQEELGYNSEAKEAIAFVILGNETLHNLPSNVPSVTGACESVILGQVTI